MNIKSFPLGPLETNCYVLTNGDKAIAVDVGGDPAAVFDYLGQRGATLETILLTHLHCDHLYGVAALGAATRAPVLAGAPDGALMDDELGRGGLMGLPLVPPFDWAPLAPGEHSFAGLACQVMATPGHSAGSLSFYFPEAKAVFVGDLLFYRSIGRTDFLGGDYDSLIGSVKTAIFTLPEATTVYPGHGPATTVGSEMSHNPYFSEFAR